MCPHAGGVALCELVQHYSLSFYISVPVCPHAGGVALCDVVQHYSLSLSTFQFQCVPMLVVLLYVN